MSNRRRLARERLEIYLVHLLLMYRPLTWVCGILLLVYALLIMIARPLSGLLVLLPALYLLLLGNYFGVVLQTAKLVAWIAALWRYDD
jgi:hypothetical protein